VRIVRPKGIEKKSESPEFSGRNRESNPLQTGPSKQRAVFFCKGRNGRVRRLCKKFSFFYELIKFTKLYIFPIIVQKKLKENSFWGIGKKIKPTFHTSENPNETGKNPNEIQTHLTSRNKGTGFCNLRHSERVFRMIWQFFHLLKVCISTI
jgi:hypothetical protein